MTARFSWFPDVRPVGVVVLLALALALVPNAGVREFGFAFVLFAVLASAWNWIGGFGGQLALGQALFFGIGAYAVTLSDVRGGSPWYGALGGGIIAVIVAVLIGALILRLRGVLFALATIAAFVLFRKLVETLPALHGAAGFVLPHKLGFLNLQFDATWPYVALALVLYAVVIALGAALERTHVGAFLRVIRVDEQSARGLGIAPLRWKLLVFVLAAFITSIAGSLFAQYALVVQPQSVLAYSLAGAIALAALLGGSAKLYGPTAGAALVAVLWIAGTTLLGPYDAIVYACECALAFALVWLRWPGIVRTGELIR